MEKFGEANLTNPEKEKDGKNSLEAEAIPKIEKLLKPSKYPSWDRITDFLFPEILPEKRAALEKKWQDVDILALDMEDPRLKEFSEDTNQLNKELGEFIKLKSPREILDRAQDVFGEYLQKGASANSVDDLMRAYHRAYEIARLFLTKGLMEEASQSCLDMIWHRIKEVDINDPRRPQLMGEIISLRHWFRDVRINLSRSPEKTGKILAYLLTKESPTDEDRKRLLNTLVATRRVEKDGKIKKIIVGLDPLRKAIKEELRSLIAAGEKEKVLMAANFLEKGGVLSLDKDADFFDAITKAGP